MEETPKKKKFKLNLKSFRIGFGSDADRDWRFMAIVFFVLLVAVVSASILNFVRFVVWAEESQTAEATFEVIDKQKLKTVIDDADARAANLRALDPKASVIIDQTPPPAIVDPAQ